MKRGTSSSRSLIAKERSDCGNLNTRRPRGRTRTLRSFFSKKHVGCDISHQFHLQTPAKCGILFFTTTAVAPVLAFRWPVDSAAPDIDVGGLEVDKMVIARTSNLLRRITTLLIISCLLTVGLCVNAAAALPGSGTQEDPWRIESPLDFDEFAADANYWSGYTRLETDVNLAGRTYSTAVIAPDIDSSKSGFQGTAFTGVFDGNDHKIIGLTIDGGAGNDYLGLFGCIRRGEVRNVRLEGGSLSGRFCVGGMVGSNGGSVSNCYSTGDVNGDGAVGGLVGDNSSFEWPYELFPGNIYNSYSTGSVQGAGEVGGLVGMNNFYGSVSNCYSTGDVNGIGWVGGLVGENGSDVGSEPHFPGYIINSYSTGDVNAVYYVGGLVGFNTGTVSNCYSIGDVSGTGWDVGGLVGVNGIFFLVPGYIINSYSTGNVNGVDIVGGLVGENAPGGVERSFWDIETSGEPNMCGNGWATPNCGKGG